MTVTRRSLLRTAGALAALPLLPAQAQDWPTRPIRILVGTAAGGSPDIVSRLLGEKLSERLGQTITIENNTQGAGAVAQQLVSRAPPDGTTALMMTAGYPPQMALRNLGFHPLDGYSFVTLVCGYPMVYAVAPDSPIKSFPRPAGESQGGPRQAHLYDHRAGLDLSRADQVDRAGGRHRHDADSLSRHLAGFAGRARRPRRRDGGCRDLDVPAHPEPGSCACSRCRQPAAIR